jgi:NAD(P)-dependent dehydrogenase (short-subunit alcohol dehydrogenase family)
MSDAVTVVTGASRGIGAATARRLAAADRLRSIRH